MKILYVVPYAPSLIRVRPYQLIQNLVRRGHSVTVATLWSSEEELADLERLEAAGPQVIVRQLTTMQSAWNCLRALPTRSPLQAAFCWQPELAQDILARVVSPASFGTDSFDVVHVEHLRGARYGLWLKQQLLAANGANAPRIVWDAVDSISHLFAQAAEKSRSLKSRLMTQLELSRTRRHEGWLVDQFDHVLVTSPVDKASMEALRGAEVERKSNGAARNSLAANAMARPRLAVLPNGVDLDYFVPTDEPRQADTLVFSGKMSYHANLSAALHLVEDIMPLVWEQRPNVKVWIVGKDPSPQIRQLAERHAPLVEVTGTVPDIRPYLRSAAIAVSPVLYSAGIQNKVLEAMACGTPVVTNPQAISALSVRPSEHVMVAADVSAFAQQILALLADPVRRQHLSQAGRAHVQQHHSWFAVAGQLEAVYQSAALSARRHDHSSVPATIDNRQLA